MVKVTWKKMVLLAIVLVIIFINAFPIKFAIKKEALEGKDYLICEHISTTGFEWMVLESSYGYEGFVELQGNWPLREYRSFYPRVRLNKFVCFGEFIGEGVFYEDEYKIFRVDRWEVLYPIIRDPALLPDFLLPKSWFVPEDALG